MSNDTQHDPREVEALAKELRRECGADVAWDVHGSPVQTQLDSDSVARFILDREARLVAALEFAVNRLRGQVNIPPLVDEGALYGICRNVADNMADALAAHRAATKPSEPTLAETVEHFLDVWDAQEGRIPVDEMRAALARARAQERAR